LGIQSPLVLVPMKINDKIYGVLEMASFKRYEDYEIELIEKFAESIASTISTVKNKRKHAHPSRKNPATGRRDEIARGRNAAEHGRTQRHARGNEPQRKRVY
jgi:hypothetical protein